MLKNILKRLREPSTMAGLSALAMVVGVPNGVTEAAVQVVAGLLALAAVVVPEKAA